jgi:hypothetical protein
MDENGAAGSRKARGLDGVGVEYPAVVGVVGAAVAAEVGDADADDVVCGGGDAKPGFAGVEAVEARSCADGVECIPDTDGGHGSGFGGRAGFVEGLGEDGESALAAHWKAEPVGLADLTETADPLAASRHGAGLGQEADGVLITAGGGVGDGDVEGFGRAGSEVGKGEGGECSGGGDLAGAVGADRLREDGEWVDRLEGELVVGGGYTGRQWDSAHVEGALESGIVGAPLGVWSADGVIEAGDGVAVIAGEAGSGNGGDRVLIEGISVGIEGA